MKEIMETPDILQNISTLPLTQRISILKKLLQTVKNDVFKQIEKNHPGNIDMFYKIFWKHNHSRPVLSGCLC